MLRLPSVLLPTVALALVASACGAEDDSSGLATLLDETPIAAPAPESGDVATGGIATPPETTEPARVTTTAASTTTADGSDEADDLPATTTAQLNTANSGEESEDEDLTDEEQLLRFADCMREHGVDFPDPVVGADGTVRFGVRPGAGGAGGVQELGRDPDLPAARQACEDLLEGLLFGRGSGDLVELQDLLLEFAQCMRDNGMEMGDPDLSNFGPGGGDDDGPGRDPFGGAIDFQDPDVAAALDVCQDEVNVNIGRFGRGGSGS